VKRLVVPAIGLIAASLSCGNDGQNLCPHGCDLPGSTIVKFQFNHYPEWGFDSDSCGDFGLGLMVHVEVVKTDDPSIVETQDTPCSNGQVTFLGLDLGTYNVSVTPLDASGTTLVKAPATGTVPAAVDNTNSTVSINVPWDSWTAAYTGNFLYTLTFDKKMCAAATPPITTQYLTLSRDGVPLSVMTHNGMQTVNGTDPKPCQTVFDYIEQLPFGPIQFKVVGQDATNVMRFQKTFDTFVGVGKFNPTLAYDVPPDAPPDAPPDSPP
jgi:hypothetical protein